MSASKRAERALLGTAALVLAAIVACGGPEASDSDGDGDSSPYVCVPGVTTICIGPGACEGAEICLPDGSGFGPCDCGGATGGTTGTGGSSSSGGSGVGGASGSAQGGASGTSPTGGTTATGGASGSSSTGGSPARVYKACVKSCTTVAECGSGAPADGPANYRCVDGGCRPSGCLSDTECNARVAGTVCRPYPGSPYNVCSTPCTGPEMCGWASEAWGPDNFSCTGGVCVYIGCHSTAECLTDFVGRPTAICAPSTPSIPYPQCNFSCQAPADCVMNATTVDADNFLCENGVCTSLGCIDETDCTLQPGTVCRPIQ